MRLWTIFFANPVEHLTLSTTLAAITRARLSSTKDLNMCRMCTCQRNKSLHDTISLACHIAAGVASAWHVTGLICPTRHCLLSAGDYPSCVWISASSETSSTMAVSLCVCVCVCVCGTCVPVPRRGHNSMQCKGQRRLCNGPPRCLHPRLWSVENGVHM